jgi:protein-L-isoaspartate(D-aspartate) O-methyltransferase
LLEQLAIGGVLVIPVGIKVQRMMRITRQSDTKYHEEDMGDFRFVPFLPGIQQK